MGDRPALSLLDQMPADQNTALAVNISAASLQGDQFITFLQTRLASTSFPRELLIFELAESVAMANLERARHFARSLKQLGCRLALDNFGAASAAATTSSIDLWICSRSMANMCAALAVKTIPPIG